MTKQEYQKEIFKRSPYYLGRYCLGYDKFTDTQIKWDKWLRAKGLRYSNRKSFKSLILQPRETYKTTFFSITECIEFIINDPNVSILLLMENYNNAKLLLSEIKSHFEINENLISIFGNYVNYAHWSKESIVVRGRERGRKEPTIFIAGKGTDVTSLHPDIIVCDDLAGKEDIYSQPERDQTLRTFQGMFDLLNKQNGILLMPGTRKHVKDIYNHIKKKIIPDLKEAGLDEFHVLETPAATSMEENEGKLNFPKILTRKKLKELRIVKQGEDALDIATYMAEYFLSPLDPKTSIFKTFHYFRLSEVKFKYIIQYTDPALSDKGTACYSAIISIGQIDGGPLNNRWACIGASMEKREPTKLIADHNRIYKRDLTDHKCEISVYMEDNGFQALLVDTVNEEVLKAGDTMVPTMGVQNSKNKDLRIRGVEPPITQGFILFRDDWKTAPEGYNILMDQLKNYPQIEKDGPDALAGAYKESMFSASFDIV